MSLEKILEQELPALGQPCSDEILSKFRRYADLLTEANTVMNLTAIAGEENIARLHFLDCAAAAQWVELDGKSAADVGSGAGFPGVVLKILHPSMRSSKMWNAFTPVRKTLPGDPIGRPLTRCLRGRWRNFPY